VTGATFERFHLYSQRPGWVLDIQLDDRIPRILAHGVGATELDLEYLDAPTLVTVDERSGTLAVAEGPSRLTAIDIGAGCARITGDLALRWNARDMEPRDFTISVDVIAALIT
jgi:hypothetical protein